MRTSTTSSHQYATLPPPSHTLPHHGIAHDFSATIARIKKRKDCRHPQDTEIVVGLLIFWRSPCSLISPWYLKSLAEAVPTYVSSVLLASVVVIGATPRIQDLLQAYLLLSLMHNY